MGSQIYFCNSQLLHVKEFKTFQVGASLFVIYILRKKNQNSNLGLSVRFIDCLHIHKANILFVLMHFGFALIFFYTKVQLLTLGIPISTVCMFSIK